MSWLAYLVGFDCVPTFRPSRLLGAGTFGQVFECSEQDERGVLVRDGLAIKYLGEEWLQDDVARSRFKREVRLTRALSHEGIVRILYSNLSAQRPYLVMPLARCNLSERLRGGLASDRDWSLGLFSSLVAAMAYAHGQGVVHRDLKPDNVLFLDSGPVICDFGMGKDLMAIGTAQTAMGRPLGSLVYMAPEQWSDGSSAGYQADVFALGKLLWELVANRQPRPWEPELELIEDERLRGFIGRCTFEDPALRYRDAAEALKAWNLLSSQLEPPRHPLDQAVELIERWTRARSSSNRGDDSLNGSADRSSDLEQIKLLDVVLARHVDDELLYYDLLPRIPDRMLAHYCRALPAKFSRTLAAYAKHTDGGLPWEYTDEAARVYATVFEASPEQSTRRLALGELLGLGERHERYNVADIVRSVLWGARDAGSAKLAAEVIQHSPQAAWYRHWRTFSRPLDPRVRAALAHAPAVASTSLRRS